MTSEYTPPDDASTRYGRIAKQHFLHGTRFSSPEECVLARRKTVEEWCDTLARARAGELQPLTAQPAQPEPDAPTKSLTTMWMVLALVEHAGECDCEAISAALKASKTQVQRWCRTLTKQRLLAREDHADNCTYTVTLQGSRALRNREQVGV